MNNKSIKEIKQKNKQCSTNPRTGRKKKTKTKKEKSAISMNFKFIPIITLLNAIGLNTFIKSQRFSNWIKKQDPTIRCFTRNPL